LNNIYISAEHSMRRFYTHNIEDMRRVQLSFITRHRWPRWATEALIGSASSFGTSKF